MKKIFWIVLPAAAVIIGYSFLSTDDPDRYVSSIEEIIDSRKRFLAFNDQSPFKLYGAQYKEPDYFPIDPAYRVRARVEPIENTQFVTINTSDGKSSRYTRHAWLHFELNGKTNRLLVLKPFGYGASSALFCAFADDTSGELTYGGGRYLDISLPGSSTLTLDFNLAYNPYCAYVDEYSCPLPPPENILSISIEAGEKTFPK